MRRAAFWIFMLVFVAGLVGAPSPQTVRTRVADGFDQPVGKPDGEGYYMSRSFRANYHMGEDWNGVGGGNTDLGDPVYSIAHGIVVMARDVRMAWGNLVIVRHTFVENRELKTVDSLYAHLDRITVREGQQVVRGQQVGTIGTNRGMYTAHLHFEIRKNLHIGFNQRRFARDLSNYHVPGKFIEPRRKLRGAGRSALVAVNTFQMPPAAPRSTPSPAASRTTTRQRQPNATPPPRSSRQPFRVNRFDESAEP